MNPKQRNLNKRVECVSREEWLEKRKYLVMASEAAVILGCSPWGSPLDLWMEKRGLESAFMDTEWLEWGKRLEPVLADAYAERTGRLVEDPGDFTIFIHPELFWWGATPDRFVYDEHRDTVGVLELKNLNAWSYKDWLGDDIPLHYLIQVQHQMAATGCDWGAIGVLVGGNTFIHRDIERDDEFLQDVTLALQAFWGSVQLGNPPATDSSEACTRALARLYGVENGSSVKLNEDMLGCHTTILDANEKIAQLEAEKRACQNALKAAIGSNSIGVLPDGNMYTFHEVKVDGYEVKPKVYRRLQYRKKKELKDG